MHLIQSDNVNGAYAQCLWDLHLSQGSGHEPENSRNGKVIRFQEPVATTYLYPWERVLFDSKRDANPFFHLFESMWMLAGRNDVAFPANFAKQILEYSDDNVTLHGAYGFRWRHHFGADQLGRIVNELRQNPTSRRCVLAMWDGYIDLDVAIVGGKDVPCNTHVYFNTRGDQRLSMTVCNRSNDIVWGCYGANAVHMSILHEYIALAAGLPLGSYTQVSNDLHLYERHWDLLGVPPSDNNPYDANWDHTPLFQPSQVDAFDRDVIKFTNNPGGADYDTPYFYDTIRPMFYAWKEYKKGFVGEAIKVAELIESEDWKKASIEWLQRRDTQLRLVRA